MFCSKKVSLSRFWPNFLSKSWLSKVLNHVWNGLVECIVCDMASTCKDWTGVAGHCHAMDNETWKSQRRRIRRRKWWNGWKTLGFHPLCFDVFSQFLQEVSDSLYNMSLSTRILEFLVISELNRSHSDFRFVHMCLCVFYDLYQGWWRYKLEQS